jgi:dedicator of cytokinesis protein 3
MLSFHDTLERFFRKNFQEEIRRLFDESSVNGEVSSSSRSQRNGPPYHAGSYDQQSISSTSLRGTNVIAPLQLGHPPLSPIPLSPHLSSSQPQGASSKQTPLQRHLRHLARHGINGVSSGPDNADSDGRRSAASPPESLITVGNATVPGAPSIAPSELRSLTGSVKGRFSRLGSLNFRKRGG